MERYTVRYVEPGLDIVVYYNVIPPTIGEGYYNRLASIVSGSSMLFGDKGVVFSTVCNGTVGYVQVDSWECSPLQEIRSLVEAMTQRRYKACLVQHHPNGWFGVERTRATKGTTMAGVSLGATRTMRFDRDRHSPFTVSLPSGCVYVINNPTTSQWRHSIPSEPEITRGRVNVVFRTH